MIERVHTFDVDATYEGRSVRLGGCEAHGRTARDAEALLRRSLQENGYQDIDVTPSRVARADLPTDTEA